MIFAVLFSLETWAGYTNPISGDNQADAGEAFGLSHGSYDGGGCGDTIQIRNRGGCTPTSPDYSRSSTGGCGGVSVSRTVTMSTNSGTACSITYSSKASACYGCDPEYESGGIDAVIVVKVNQKLTITGAPAANINVGTVSTSLDYTATNTNGAFNTKNVAGNAVTWAASGTNGCTVDQNGLVKYGFGPGTCTVTLSISGTADLAAASTSFTTTLVQQAQSMTITTAAPAGPIQYNQFFNVAATATSGYEVVITSTGGCNVARTGAGTAKVTITSTLASCVLYYNQNGQNTTGYQVFTPVAQQTSTTTVSATKLNQTITFPVIAAQTYANGGTFNLNATASSGYLVTYTATGTCSLTGPGNDIVLMNGVGTCTIKADQAGNLNYNAAPQVSQNISITKANQTINVTTPAPASASQGTTFPVAASSTSGLAVTIAASGCTNTSGTISGLAVGTTCTITYTQAGNTNFNAATAVVSNTAVSQIAQTITITQVPAGSVVLNSSFNVAAISDSGLAVAISVPASGPGSGCIITAGGSGSATIKLTSGTVACTVRYNQAGNATYAAAAQQVNNVVAIRKSQTIAVTTAAPVSALLNATFNVAAQAREGNTTTPSGLAVAITVAGGCSITVGGSNTATIKMTSSTTSCTVSYNQAGDDYYSPAATINNVVKDGTAPVIALVTAVSNPSNSNPELTFTTNETGTIIYTGACSSDTTIASSGNNTVVFKTMAAGTYTNCTVAVMDAFGNTSNVLSLASFTVVPKIIRYVKTEAAGTGDCSSWANACADIQTAINASGVTEVWIAKGIYKPAATINLKANVGVYGGFVGNESNYTPSVITVDINQNSGVWNTAVDYGVSKKIENLTIISGDKDNNDTVDSRGLVMSAADVAGTNLAQLMKADNLSLTESRKAKISGLIFNAASGAANGAGLVVNNSIVEADRVQFVFNKAANGGAVAVTGGGKFTAIDSVFLKNTATALGGAVVSTDSTSNQISLQRSNLEGNAASTNGGAVYMSKGKLWIMNSTLFGNGLTSTSGKGGAVDLSTLAYPSAADIRYVTMLNNTAGPDAATAAGRGGAVNIDSSATAVATLANSMVMANSALSTGGQNISGIDKLTDGGYNVVGFNGISGMVTAAAAAYDFLGGSSVTAPTTLLKDIIEIDALGVPLLTNNGGYTASVKLTETSFARDRIPNIHADCEKLNSVGVDQRGYARPQVDGNFCDVGAVEWDKTDPCTDPNRQKGFFLMFYPDAVCIANGGLNVSMGTVNPFFLLLMAFIGAGLQRKKTPMKIKR